jgi:hypothetical protein
MILEVSLDGLWTLSFGLSQFHGHGSWLVREVAQRHEYDNCQLETCLIIVIVDPTLFFRKERNTAYNLRLNNVLLTHDSMWRFLIQLKFWSSRRMVTKFLVGSSRHGRLD